jgi:hypothetical protein
VTQPVWDGKGVDPWLPTRLAHTKAVTVGERTIFDDYYARLSRWLVEASRVTKRGGLVDPNAVWSLVPAWVESMTEFVHTAISDVVGAAYRTMFGPGYRYDQRPFVTAYLAEVRNRLLDVPEQVFDQVAGQVAEGASMGESMPAIAARVQQVFNTTDTPYWENRAVTVARTETIGAYNAGRSDAFAVLADDLDEQLEQAWLATADNRTRPTHRAADFMTPGTGQRVPLGTPFTVGESKLDRPGDPKGPAKEVVQCRCTTLLLRPGEMVDLSNRQFTDF